MGDHEQTGLAGAFSVDEYRRDVIVKHERTRKDKEDDRTRHITELRAQTGPVLLTFRETASSSSAGARRRLSALTRRQPEAILTPAKAFVRRRIMFAKKIFTVC